MQVAENHHSGPVRPLRGLYRLAAPAALFLITIAVYWKLVRTDEYTWLEGPDLAYQVLPWFQMQAAEWHKGRLPLWDPYLWGGQPLLGQAQPGAAYPLNWLLFSLPLRNGWIRQSYLHWYFVLVHYMAALFCYLLCRDLGRSRLAGVAAGCAFAFGGFIAYIDWPQMLNGAIWTPLVFLFVFRAIRGVRPLASAVLGGFFLGLAWLSGHHQAPIFISLAVTGVWLWSGLRHGGVDRAILRPASTFVIVALLTSGLQTLPALEYGRLAKRWVNLEQPVGWSQPVPYSIHEQFSLPPASLLGLIFPGMSENTNPFMGVVVVVLCIAGFACSWRDPAGRVFAGLGLFGLLVALGGGTIVHGLLYAFVPLAEKARSPSMAVLILSFSVAVLSAWGIDSLLDRHGGWWRPAARATLALGGVVVSVALVLALAGKGPMNPRWMLTGLVALAAAALLFAALREAIAARPAAISLVALALLELGSNATAELPSRFQPELKSNLKKYSQVSDIASFLRSRDGLVRFEVDEREIPFNLGDWFGLEQWNGFLASLTENVERLERHTDRTGSLFAVNYAIASKPYRPGQVIEFENPNGLKVLRNPAALPRVRTVHELVKLKQPGEVARFIEDVDNDLSRTAVVFDNLPDLERCQSDWVRLVSQETSRVTIVASMACRGMVILADTYFPGWQARIDGEPARLYAPFGVLRGVVVERGDHLIDMEYRPRSVLAGGIASGIGLVLALIGAAWPRQKKA